MNSAQASYPLVRARIQVRLAELRAALDRHEAEQRWEQAEDLERVEAKLTELVAEMETP